MTVPDQPRDQGPLEGPGSRPPDRPVAPDSAAPPVAGPSAWSAPEQDASSSADPWSGAPPPGWGGPPPSSPAGPAPGWAQLAGPQPAPYGAVVVRRGIVPIKPLGLGDILEGAFRAIRHNPRVMLGFTLAVVIVATLLGSVPFVASFGSFAARIDQAATPEEALSALVGLSVGSMVSGLIFALAGIIVTGLLTVSVGQSVVDRRIGIAEAWRRVRGRLPPLLLQGLLITAVTISPSVLAIGIAVLVGLAAGGLAGVVVGLLLLLAALVVTVYVVVSWSLAPAALVLEQAGVLGSLRRSWRLVRTAFWRTLGILLLSYIIISLIAQILAVPFGLLGGIVPALDPDNQALLVGSLAVTYAVSSLLSVIVYPFIAAVVTLLYIDRRIRTEGLDIALTRSLSAPVTVTG